MRIPSFFQQILIEHGAATKSFPQDTDIAARDCHQHERRKDDADQRCHEQVDNQCWQLALYKTPPCKARSARGWLIVNGHQMGIHCSARVRTCQVLTVIGASSYPMNEAIAPSVPSLSALVR